MKNIDVKKMPKMSILLYSCSILMALCILFVIYKSNTYISGLVEQGFDPKKEIVEVINYYLGAITPFVFYTISLTALGYIVQKIDYIIKGQGVIVENNECLGEELKNNDDEIDDLFSDI